MPRSHAHPRAGRLVAVALTLACALALLPSGAPAHAQGVPAEAQSDPGVIEARRRADELDAQAAALGLRLDEAAARYEATRAHALRVEEEGAGAEVQVADALAVQDAAEEAVRQRVRDAYKAPAGPLAMTSAVVEAEDAAHALYRVELLQEVDQREAEDLKQHRQWAELQLDETTSLEVVGAGSAAAAERQRLAADELTVTLATAQSRLTTARANITVAVEDAERRIEEERRRQAEAAAAAEALRLASQQAAASAGIPFTGGAAPLPALGGRYCPIGSPNAFSDTWGAPRSGGRQHKGVDIFGAYGTPNYAVEGGTVRVTNGGLGGLAVHLRGDSGDRYYYAHLSAVDVTAGQRVQAGQVIGRVGQSGNARTTPPHTHFQYHPGGAGPVNPTPLTTALCR